MKSKINLLNKRKSKNNKTTLFGQYCCYKNNKLK